MNELRLYGSITRKMIAGIIVMYAIAPAAFSDNPPCCTEAAAVVPVVVFAPQCGQKVELLPVSVLQAGQIMATRSLAEDRVPGRLRAHCLRGPIDPLCRLPVPTFAGGR